MIFKKELLATASTEQKAKILDILSQNKIKYSLKTKDKFIYHIYVSKREYENAAFLLRQNQF